MNKRLLGIVGEIFAVLLLKVKCYKILSRNYRSKYGEIDIIAKKKDIIAFVEVKVRSNINTFDQPVYPDQIQRIKRSAELFLIKNKIYNKNLNIRFDLIILRNLFKWEHYQNVW